MNNAIHNQGFLLEGEVKNSIAGHRAEPTSVDTGNFLNSVHTDNSQMLVSRVSSEAKYAQHLEKGTSKMAARRHFENSTARKKNSINTGIRLAIKSP